MKRKILALRLNTAGSGAYKDYSACVKDLIEDSQPQLLSRGSMFLLTNSAVRKHWDRYHHLLESQDRFVVVENNQSVIPSIESELTGLPIELVCGDFMETVMSSLAVFRRAKSVSKIGYLHFDGCSTAVELQRTGFHQQLHTLSRSKGLGNEFSLEITVSTRGDKNCQAGRNLVNHVIPETFLQSSWSLSGSSVSSYRNPRLLMLNGKYKFKRKSYAAV